MGIDELNSRFGAPGRIVFRQGLAGHPNVVLANKYGTAEVALYGAVALSYRPTGQSEVLFRPARKDAEYTDESNLHGGVPVCWPMFGNRLDRSLPQHGFARKSLFEVRSTEYSEEQTEVTLDLKSSAATKAIWPHDFTLQVKISVTMKLNLSITTRNTGAEPFVFSDGFHPYFLLRERDLATVRGLEGCKFVDARQEPFQEGVMAGELKVNTGYDHVFTMPKAPKHEYAILDAGLKRAIAMVSTGNDMSIVWNADGEYVVEDQSPTDYRRLVCVEPVSDWPGGRTLQPGEEHVLAASIQATLDMPRES